MKEPELPICPIEISQKTFDAELYRYGLNQGKHCWHGSCIKVDALIECLEKATTDYIIFSDIDIVVKPGVYGILKPYMDEGYDMVYLNEANLLNIGFILLRTNKKVLDFWKSVKTAMEAEMDHDQKYVNKLIHSFDGRWALFDRKYMVCTNEWDGKDTYKVLQVLCSNLGKEFNLAEKILGVAQHVQLNPYIQYIDREILPYMVEFQNIIARQMARKKASAEAQ